MYINLLNVNAIYLALSAGMFALMFTILGSAVVFFFKSVNKNIMDSMLAISAGIMLAASYFSLLNPAIEISNSLHLITWLILLVGFFGGGLLLYFGDKILEKSLKNNKSSFSIRRCIMLISSITLHNIPEGLVIGVAFGAASYAMDGASLVAAATLTLGIAIQNFPEGSAISLPLRREGLSRRNSFLLAALSGIVEPISAVLGAILVMKIQILLPIILSFAAGAMIFVTTTELIPDCQLNAKKDLMALLIIVGFAFMMILEIILG